MESNNKLSLKIIKKIVFISVGLICLFSLGVLATKADLNYVTISFPDDCEITVVTSKTKVADILTDNHIIILPEENVYPPLDKNIDSTNKIIISEEIIESKIISEQVENISTEEILGKYVKITEKIITEQVEIPYETITKDVSTEDAETQDSIIQQGVNGIKEIKYKVKYQDDLEINRTVLSENVIKQPINKIIQISNKITSRAGTRMAGASSEAIASSTAGKEPIVTTLNASAYCACVQCCGKSNGITSSGNPAREWHTVAAGSGYPIGTVIYIPAFESQPNGGWFVVEDRGGAISNNKIDVFMGSHAAAIQFGRRNLECYIYY